jgi:putative protease
MPTQSRPELLAPAGNWDCARAAVANGADAIYFGLPAFNARMRADNFTEDDLPELMRFLHSHGVRGYLTFNILVFTGELAEAERFLRVAEQAGVDAIIVQDLGAVRLAAAVAPALEIHASTQMTITSPEGVRFAKSIGVTRVVVARELSLRELAKFRADEPDMLPVETFVHGALCVAYSGQCLTSESLGQRSANRGECAQACRLPYELVVDGETRDLGDRRYLLSPQDLAAIDDVPALIEAGVCSFKIEGRLKTPEYVAAVSQVYRRAIDRALAGGAKYTVPAADRYKLEMTFSRGLFSGWLHGVDHQALVHARFGTKRGPFAGRVTRVGPDFVEIAGEGETPLKAGDGVVFDTGANTDDEQGGRIFELRERRLYFQHGKIDFRRIQPGDRVWKTSDPALERELRKTFEHGVPARARGVAFVVSGRAGEPLCVEAACEGARVEDATTCVLQTARAHALDTAALRAQLGRLGGTGFEIESLENRIEGEVFVPVRELNELRRRLVEKLGAALESRAPSAVPRAPITAEVLLAGVREQRRRSVDTPVRLSVLCRTMAQIEASLSAGVDRVYVDFEDIRRYPDAVALGRTRPEIPLLLATPRIQKAGEQGFFKLIENAAPQGVLVRNLGGLAHFQDSRLLRVGDFSLNVANPLTASVLMERGFDHLTVSYDLNHRQVCDLLEGAPPEWFELTLHQHMPLFHMEHCVFAAFLSNGRTYVDCGRPCEKHDLRLRDRLGVEHPVKVDVGCRNTVYHAKAQSGATYLAEFVARGLRRVRVELVDEDAARTSALLGAYRALLGGALEPAALLSRLKVVGQLGVTEGTLAARL